MVIAHKQFCRALPQMSSFGEMREEAAATDTPINRSLVLVHVRPV